MESAARTNFMIARKVYICKSVVAACLFVVRLILYGYWWSTVAVWAAILRVLTDELRSRAREQSMRRWRRTKGLRYANVRCPTKSYADMEPNPNRNERFVRCH
jgi:hypothetical protein